MLTCKHYFWWGGNLSFSLSSQSTIFHSVLLSTYCNSSAFSKRLQLALQLSKTRPLDHLTVLLNQQNATVSLYLCKQRWFEELVFLHLAAAVLQKARKTLVPMLNSREEEFGSNFAATLHVLQMLMIYPASFLYLSTHKAFLCRGSTYTGLENNRYVCDVC